LNTDSHRMILVSSSSPLKRSRGSRDEDEDEDVE
jgi:hypothetical protein